MARPERPRQEFYLKFLAFGFLKICSQIPGVYFVAKTYLVYSGRTRITSRTEKNGGPELILECVRCRFLSVQ